VIFATLEDAGIRVGRFHTTMDDAVALCESGLGLWRRGNRCIARRPSV